MMSFCCFFGHSVLCDFLRKMDWPVARQGKLNPVCEAQETGQHNTITVSGQEPMCIEPNDLISLTCIFFSLSPGNTEEI